jgi:hypothetical protein
MGQDINHITLALPLWITDEIDSVAAAVRLTGAIGKHNRENRVSHSRFASFVQLIANRAGKRVGLSVRASTSAIEM